MMSVEGQPQAQAEQSGNGQLASVTTNGSAVQSTSSSAANGHMKSSYSKFIQAGDLVIIFMSRDKPPVPITVTPGQEVSNTYGTFLHDSMIGLPFGAKVSTCV
jgi:hypothetical protein